MNTIIGYISDGKVSLASSTASYVNGIRRVERTVENYPFKILKNGIVIGFIGDRTARQVLFSHSRIFKLDRNKDLTMSYVTGVLIPEIHDLFHDADVETSSDDGLMGFAGNIIIAYKDKAFKIYGDYEVELSLQYFAMGKFKVFSRVYLHEIDRHKDIEEQLVDCFRNACGNTDDIQAPFITVNTKDLHFNIVED
ncbi:MAG: hypothetical protein J5656_01540 [Clostridia bacterium]|nr:hypothetical protein [Clostridia bacterium]